MSILPIVTYPDPILKRISRPVERVNGEVLGLIEDMVETMHAAPGVGLAAPQVGRSLRVIVADVSPHEETKEIISIVNPQIVWAEGEVIREEGCLSLPGLKVEVPRKERVRIRGLDSRGKRMEFEADGLLAIVLQHEVDHLNGRLIIDRLSSLRRQIYRKKMLKAHQAKADAWA